MVFGYLPQFWPLFSRRSAGLGFNLTKSGDFDIGHKRLCNIADPVDQNDCISKSYFNSYVSTIKASLKKSDINPIKTEVTNLEVLEVVPLKQRLSVVEQNFKQTNTKTNITDAISDFKQNELEPIIENVAINLVKRNNTAVVTMQINALKSSDIKPLQSRVTNVEKSVSQIDS